MPSKTIIFSPTKPSVAYLSKTDPGFISYDKDKSLDPANWRLLSQEELTRFYADAREEHQITIANAAKPRSLSFESTSSDAETTCSSKTPSMSSRESSPPPAPASDDSSPSFHLRSKSNEEARNAYASKFTGLLPPQKSFITKEA